MKTASRYLGLVLLLAAYGVIFHDNSAEARDDEEFTLVGRISHVEGKLLRYIEEENDWVVTVEDSPFGLNDALYSGDYAKAEFMMPNRTWLRTGENTQVQLIDLNPEATTVDMASGLARLYNKSADVVIKVTTPFGYVVAPGGTVFDLYVGDDSLEVIAVDGDIDFVHFGTKSRYEVLEGYSSIVAGEREVAGGNGAVDAVWDDWNRERDDLWETRLRRSKYSAGFLPEWIQEESYYLEENGRWERIYYEGSYRDMWRPTRIERGWRPFTAGRWTVYYGDNCWVPDEPFGYVTHHYGSWIYVESHRGWFWLPPAARYVSDSPKFFIGFGWHPGRVGWIHSGPSIGWVPLAWDEEYYGHRHWGHRTVIVRPHTVININIFRYRYLDEAVIIPRDHFFRGTRYTPLVRRDVNRDIIVNNYQPVTVINNTVINNYNIDKRRFAYNDAEVDRKPHVTVVNRINANQRTISEIDRIGRERIERDLTRFNVRSEPPPRTDMARPVLTTKLVEPDKVARPITDLSLERKELKPRERERQIAAGSEERRRPRDRGGMREGVQQEGQREASAPRDAVVEPGQVGREQDRSPQPGAEPREPEKLERQQGEEVQGRRGPQRPPELRRDLADEPPQQVQESDRTEEKPRLRSPREKGGPEVEQRSGQREQIRPEAGLRPRPQEQEVKRPQTEDVQGPREPQRPPELRRDQAEEPPQQVQESDRTEEKPRLRSPREKGGPDEQSARRQQENELREQQKIQSRQQEEVRRQEQQQARQRQEERDRQQQQAVEAARKKQEDDNARRQEQARQKQENQLREQQKIQSRQQEEVRRQEQQQARQRQEEQDRQQQQAAEAARKKQEDDNARRQELARQKQENQLREQQKIQSRQQEEVRRQEQQQARQRQEEQDRQQQQAVEAARKKKEDDNARKQEQARPQDQARPPENQVQEEQKRQQEKKKKKKQEEEQPPAQ